MAARVLRISRLGAAILAGAGLLVAVLLALFWDDLASTSLDPKTPYQTYRPPPAPDYGRLDSWRLWSRSVGAPSADVFFIAPTTYDGGRHWNAPIDEPRARRQFEEVMAPNYVGPFLADGRVYAPAYRQASLYSLTTLREDAREARRFAYGDVRDAFRRFAAIRDKGRPYFLVGVEQGGTLSLRLLTDEIARDRDLRTQLVAAYAIETVAPAAGLPLDPCATPTQTGCLAAWAAVRSGDDDAARRLLDRALVWSPGGDLVNLGKRPAQCFNPVMGEATGVLSPARLHRGGANASGLEWGTRPAFIAREVTAQCTDGLLRISRPRSPAFRPNGSWADRRKAPGYNLFYADVETDARRRLASFLAR